MSLAFESARPVPRGGFVAFAHKRTGLNIASMKPRSAHAWETKGAKMSMTTGEEATKDGTFRCSNCQEEIAVKKGNPMPKCPGCGNRTFEARQDRELEPTQK